MQLMALFAVCSVQTDQLHFQRCVSWQSSIRLRSKGGKYTSQARLIRGTSIESCCPVIETAQCANVLYEFSTSCVQKVVQSQLRINSDAEISGFLGVWSVVLPTVKSVKGIFCAFMTA